jgi:two-component system sensor histidine kinase BarA
MLCVDLEKIELHQARRSRNASVLIAVCAQGDGRSEELFASGQVDACLTRPVLRSEVEELLKRVCSGDRDFQPAAISRNAQPVTRFRAFRALVADDNAVNREVAFEALSQLNASVVTVENGRKAVDAAAVNMFDIVFMDGSMPVMDGFEAARRIRSGEVGSRRVPIVALTAHVVGTAAEEWRDAGMDAVVHKPFTVAALAKVIERLLPGLSGSAAGKGAPQASGNIEPEASPAALDSAVLDELRHLQANGQVGFVKKVLGLYLEHAPLAVAQIRQAAGEGSATDCARAAHALKSMSHNVGARPMSALATQIETRGKLHASPPDEALLAELDRALAMTLEAIARQPEMSGADATSAHAGETLAEALARAIERNELCLHYQPIVDRTGAATVGVEALLRWQHKGKNVSPAEFIPLAERNGSIHLIGEWVLRQACIDARAWPGLTLSVNVSAVQFGASDLAERIEGIVLETGFEWRRLQLEITETALLTAEDMVQSVMKRLKDKGVSVALDDFGTGYSSLTYLRRFPFDKIKIDKSFIADITLTVNATIVHAVTSIGRSLGLKLVAEGVENSDQHRFLAAAGVHYLQGYLFGRPVTADALTERLRQERQATQSA